MLKKVNKCVIFSSFRSTVRHCFKMFDFYAPQNYPVMHYDHGQQTTVEKWKDHETARIWMKLPKYWGRHWQHLTTAMRDFFTGERFIHEKVAIFSRKIAPGPSNRRAWNFHLIRDCLSVLPRVQRRCEQASIAPLIKFGYHQVQALLSQLIPNQRFKCKELFQPWFNVTVK